jgi:hypothetical protein
MPSAQGASIATARSCSEHRLEHCGGLRERLIWALVGRGTVSAITAMRPSRPLEQLTNAGDFSRSWFEQSMPACAKEGGCNFTTIGGIFELLGYAVYDRGTYRNTGPS